MNTEKNEISEETFSYFRDVLPPIAMGKHAILLLEGSGEDVSGWVDAHICSEPCSHEMDARTGNHYPTFVFCFEKDGKFFKGTTAPDKDIAAAYSCLY